MTSLRIAVLGSGVRWNGGQAPAYLAAAAEPGAEVLGVGLRGSAFPYTAAEHVLVEALLLDAGLRALEQHASAIFIDTFGEYALDAIRAITDVPVVGAAEAAIAAARVVGPRFAVVTVWPDSMRWLYDARLARHGATAECLGVTYVGSASGRGTGAAVADRVRDEVAAGAAGLRGEVVAACRAAAASGACSIVLGCTCMAPMHEELVAAVPVPVICASRTGFQAATRAARSFSSAGGATRVPDPRLVACIKAAASAIGLAGASPASGADPTAESGTGCPVCVTTDDTP